MADVTRILEELARGSNRSADALLPAVYDELRRMAAAKLANERDGHSLNATGLVHEAYLRLVGNQSFESRRHFFGAAAEAMRRILIEQARARGTRKRGGDAVRIEIEPELIADFKVKDERLEMLDEALTRFERTEPEKAELVKLRYFVGMTVDEAADVMGISTATADRHWAYAKAWLQTELASQ
jgi:RNA polymerase sigma factor (TIGR02999 family)